LCDATYVAAENLVDSATLTTASEIFDGYDERSQLTSHESNPNESSNFSNAAEMLEQRPSTLSKSSSTRTGQVSVQVHGGSAQDEQREGSVTSQTYASYIGAAGGVFAVVVVIAAGLIAEGSRAFSFWWLAHWLEQGSAVRNFSIIYYIVL
jgi:hypothetical protein